MPKKEASPEDLLVWIVFVAVLAFAGSLFAFLFQFGVRLQFSIAEDSKQWAEFGDFLGGITSPIIAALALLLLAISVNLQRRTLYATREEMQATKSVVERQNFDSRFFASMSLLNEIRQTERFSAFVIQGTTDINSILKNTVEHSKNSIFLRAALDDLAGQINPFIALVTSLMKMIEQSKLDASEREVYAEILRSLVQREEAFLTAVCAAFDLVPPEFHRLADIYKILLNVSIEPINTLINYMDHANMKAPKSLSFLGFS